MNGDEEYNNPTEPDHDFSGRLKKSTDKRKPKEIDDVFCVVLVANTAARIANHRIDIIVRQANRTANSGVHIGVCVEGSDNYAPFQIRLQQGRGSRHPVNRSLTNIQSSVRPG